MTPKPSFKRCALVRAFRWSYYFSYTIDFRGVNIQNTESHFFSVFDKSSFGPTDRLVGLSIMTTSIFPPGSSFVPESSRGCVGCHQTLYGIGKLGIVFSLGFVNKSRTMVDETSRERTGTHGSSCQENRTLVNK